MERGQRNIERMCHRIDTSRWIHLRSKTHLSGRGVGTCEGMAGERAPKPEKYKVSEGNEGGEGTGETGVTQRLMGLACTAEEFTSMLQATGGNQIILRRYIIKFSF